MESARDGATCRPPGAKLNAARPKKEKTFRREATSLLFQSFWRLPSSIVAARWYARGISAGLAARNGPFFTLSPFVARRT